MRRGFSLAEILIVMVIVAVLCCLLFPVLSQSRMRAKETTCMSNLHQTYLAAKLYQSEEGDYPPDGRISLLNGGVAMLRCPEQHDQALPWDYTLVSRPTLNVPGHDSIKNFDNCRAIRGESMPLVVDQNHATVPYGYAWGRQPFFLVRESGGAATVDASIYKSMLSGRTPAPCSISQMITNL